MSGRRPHSRGVYSLRDSDPPPEITLDTSFVVACLSQAEPSHAEALGFLNRAVTNQSLVVYNRLLEIELVEASFKLAIKEQFGKFNPAKRRDGRVRKRAARLSDDLLGSWRDVLESVPSLCIELQEVADGVPAAMGRRGLASYDAVHALTAIYSSNGYIATTDSGFGSAPASELTIFIDQSRLGACRRHRGGRGT